MSDVRLQQMLDQQQGAQFVPPEQEQTALPLIQGGPGDPASMQSFQKQQKVPPLGGPQPPMTSIMTPSTGAQQTGFTNNAMSKILQKAGIDDKGLAFNEMGRVQLVGRLRKKYGEQYNQSPEALDILSAFDKEVKKSPITSTRSMTAAIAGGERTLRALLGGK